MKNFLGRMKHALVAATFAATAPTVSATVIWDNSVDHSAEVGTAAGVLAGSLSTGTLSYGGAGGLAGALAGAGAGDVLIIGQNANSNTAGSVAAVSSFVSSGGTLINLWGNGFVSSPVLTGVTGEALSFVFGGSTGSFTATQTAAAVGTSFAAAPASLTSASNHGAITEASIALGSGTSMYTAGGNSHAAVWSIGAGTAAFLSWDWCCGASATTRAEWDEVMLAAATYSADVPEPATIALVSLGLLGFSRRASKARS